MNESSRPLRITAAVLMTASFGLFAVPAGAEVTAPAGLSGDVPCAGGTSTQVLSSVERAPCPAPVATRFPWCSWAPV